MTSTQEEEEEVNQTTNTLSQQDEQVRKQWEEEQITLKEQLILEDDFTWTPTTSMKYVGGVDISFNKDNITNPNDAVASLVVCSYPELNVVYEAYHRVNMDLPYIPGYLGFREVPHLITLVDELRDKQPEFVPDIILVDGNGILHPRGFGLACHLGILRNIPTIGVAKNLLYMDGLTREVIKELCDQHLKKSGDVCNLKGDSGMIHGALVKATDDTVRPLYVSPGHRVSLDTSVEIVKLCCKYRIPEPVRQADLRSRDAIRNINKPPTTDNKKQKNQKQKN
jgi:deoxyinosine 3'endonuclease (endonuclease V)